MSAPDAPTTPPSPSHLGRRLMARLIDDTVLVGISIFIAVTIANAIGGVDGEGIFYGGPDGSESAWTAYAPLSDESSGHQGSFILLTGVLATLFFLLVVLVSSMTRGTTLGKMTTGLRVVMDDGFPASQRVLAGRECLRVALVGVALAVIAPVVVPLGRLGGGLFGTMFSSEVAQVSAAMSTLLPIGLVAAGFLGAAMVHPDGRAVHDRLSRTRVVRTRELEPGVDDDR